MKMQRRMRTALVASLLAAVALAGCGSDSSKDNKAGAVSTSPARRSTSASATSRTSPTPRPLVGVEKGHLRREARRERHPAHRSTFNAGPAAVEALFDGAIDATYIGPNPAINAFAKSQRRGHPDHLRSHLGRRLPGRQAEHQQAGGPQGQEDRHPAAGQHPGRGAAEPGSKANGLKTDTQGGGDVSIMPQENGQTLEAFKSGLDRRRLGARALGHPPGPGGQRQGPRRRADPVARRRSSSPPT